MSDILPQSAPHGQYNLKPGMLLQVSPRTGEFLRSASEISVL